MDGKGFLTPFKVGLVVLAGIAVTIYMLTRVSQDFSKGEPTYLVHAYFDDATGLAEKSQVRVAGIQVGEVQSIDLEGNRAKVSIRVASRVKLLEGDPKNGFKNGATVSRKASSLLGDFYLELTPGTDTDPPSYSAIPDGGEVHLVLKAAGTDAILSEMEKITKDISQITGSLSGVIGGAEGQLRLDSIVQDVHDTTQAIRDLIANNKNTIDKIILNVDASIENIQDTTAAVYKLINDKSKDIDRIVADVERTTKEVSLIAADSRKEIQGALSNVRDITRNAKTIVNSAGQKFDLALDKLDGGIDRAVASVESLERSLKNVEETTQDVQKVSGDIADGKGSMGRLLSDDTLVRDTEALVADSRELIQNTNKAVAQLDSVLGPAGRLQIHIDWRNDYMFEFDAFKNIIALKLQPSPSKWYQIEVVRDPRGTSSTVRRVRDATGEQPTYEEVTETTSDLKFSVEFAGVYDDWLVGRFGLIENTGGVGTNLRFFDHNLEFILDFFDFGFAEYPRFRAVGMLYTDVIIPYEWAQYTYISGGIDDVFNDGTRDYFVGAGLSFTDADLKGILPFAPSP